MSSRFQKARAFKTWERTSGDLTVASAAWADLPTIGTAWDTTIAAAVGDVLEAEVSALVGNEAPGLAFDVATIVAGAAVNYFGTAPGGTGVGGWRAVGGQYETVGGSAFYTVVAGDLASGYVTARLRCKGDSGANKTIFAAAATATLQFTVKNLGPADPN